MTNQPENSVPDAHRDILTAIDPQRLVETAIRLIDVPSPTRSAGKAADCLDQILTEEGFAVERPVADWPDSPAVVARLRSGRPGRTLQFSGHLDTVHLPYKPSHLTDGILRGSGASDMKGGLAAAVEAMRALRDVGLPAGEILLTAYDHHEGPWGDRRQVHALIAAGYTGDAVLIPEYLPQPLPLAGRGSGIFDIRLTRAGEPIHEVLRDPEQPDVLQAGAELVCRLRNWNTRLAQTTAPYAGSDSVFVGSIASGEIYNQSPIECRITGTRRWVAPGTVDEVEREFRSFVAALAEEHGVDAGVDYHVSADAFRIDPDSLIVEALQSAQETVTGKRLPTGGKPFVDDGNSFAARAGIPALTHGPDAKGAHTVDEWVTVAELERVARVYALAALHFVEA